MLHSLLIQFTAFFVSQQRSAAFGSMKYWHHQFEFYRGPFQLPRLSLNAALMHPGRPVQCEHLNIKMLVIDLRV